MIDELPNLDVAQLPAMSMRMLKLHNLIQATTQFQNVPRPQLQT